MEKLSIQWILLNLNSADLENNLCSTQYLQHLIFSNFEVRTFYLPAYFSNEVQHTFKLDNVFMCNINHLSNIQCREAN